MTARTDEQLMVSLVEEDDLNSFEELLTRYENLLFNYIVRYISDVHTAQDLFQETFYRIFKHRKSFNPDLKFSSWAYRIATNLCIDEFRKKERELEVSLEDDKPHQEPTFPTGHRGIDMITPNSSPEGRLIKKDLEEKITKMLEEKYLRDPQVSVSIKEYQSGKVFVLGAVRNPGPYALLGRKTLMAMISESGGLTEIAGDSILVIRESPDGTNRRLEISKEDLMIKGDPLLNIPLQPNDTVLIPADQMVFIYVYGQVKNPGALAVKKSKIPTLLQAIVQAGGFGIRASKRRVWVRRVDELGREERILINVKEIERGKKRDFQLRENDVVHVSESIF